MKPSSIIDNIPFHIHDFLTLTFREYNKTCIKGKKGNYSVEFKIFITDFINPISINEIKEIYVYFRKFDYIAKFGVIDHLDSV